MEVPSDGRASLIYSGKTIPKCIAYAQLVAVPVSSLAALLPQLGSFERIVLSPATTWDDAEKLAEFAKGWHATTSPVVKLSATFFAALRHEYGLDMVSASGNRYSQIIEAIPGSIPAIDE
jgi:hypothetical protein